MNLAKLSVVLLASLLTACSFPGVYKIPIHQGNTLDEEELEHLETGLTMSQVRFLLGTPLIVDPLSPGRWDFVYNLKQGDKVYKDVHLVVYFNNQNRVSKIDRIRSHVYGGGKTLKEISESKNNASSEAAEDNNINEDAEQTNKPLDS